MLQKVKHFSLLAVLTFLVSTMSARAIPFLELESVYEGDGWFRYTLTLPVDHFTPYVKVTGLDIQASGPFQEVVLPAGWAAHPDDETTWIPLETLTRPSRYVFRCRSNYRHFKKASPACIFSLTAISSEGSGLDFDLNGLAWCDGLVPCPPGEADGSAPLLKAKVQTQPDLKITSIHHAQGKVTGISINWSIPLEYTVEASNNLADWQEVVTAFPTDGRIDLSSFDNLAPFIRIRISDAASPYPPMTSSAISTPAGQKLIKKAAVEMKDGRMTIIFPSTEGVPYTVEFLSFSGQLLGKVDITGNGPKTTVPAPAGLTSGPLLLRVYATQSSTR